MKKQIVKIAEFVKISGIPRSRILKLRKDGKIQGISKLGGRDWYCNVDVCMKSIYNHMAKESFVPSQIENMVDSVLADIRKGRK